LPFTLKDELTHFIVECTGNFAICVHLHFFMRIFRLALSNSADAEDLRAEAQVSSSQRYLSWLNSNDLVCRKSPIWVVHRYRCR
jgi:hypothetical protein